MLHGANSKEGAKYRRLIVKKMAILVSIKLHEEGSSKGEV